MWIPFDRTFPTNNNSNGNSSSKYHIFDGFEFECLQLGSLGYLSVFGGICRLLINDASVFENSNVDKRFHVAFYWGTMDSVVDLKVQLCLRLFLLSNDAIYWMLLMFTGGTVKVFIFICSD